MDKGDVDKLRKLHALTDSSNQHEASAALEKCKALLGRHGKKMVDVLDILGTQKIDFGYDVAGTWNAAWEASKQQAAQEAADKARQQQAAYQENRRKADEATRRENAQDRAAVIARYGSAEAAIAPCEREKLLRKAVRKWSVSCDPPNQRWTKSLDGCTFVSYATDKLPPRVVAAISNALPLPDTIEGAVGEFAYWHRRSGEIDLAAEIYGGCSSLDLAVNVREAILCELATFRLRARNTQEVVLRLRFSGHYLVDPPSKEIIEAAVADLAALDAAGQRETVVDFQAFRAAGQKRQPTIKPVRKTKAAPQGQFGFGF